MNIEKNNLMRNKALKTAGILVLVLGILFAGRYFFMPKLMAASERNNGQSIGNVAVINGSVQDVTIDLKSDSYTPIVVQKGIPVKFHIRAEQANINSCNGKIVIPEFNKQITLKPGDNVLEFTPLKSGNVSYSCWMGMISSNIQVVDNISTIDEDALTAVPAAGNRPVSCCQRQQ